MVYDLIFGFSIIEFCVLLINLSVILLIFFDINKS